MNKIETTKKEQTVFWAVAFGLTYLMGVPLYFLQQAGGDTSCFANAQMFYPAAGVMLAYLLARRPELPRRFYLLHLLITAGCIGISFASVFSPDPNWIFYASLLIILGSLLGWILLLTDRKSRREAYGLRWRGGFKAAVGICLLFLVLKTAVVFLSYALEGGEAWSAYLAYWGSFVPWLNMLILIPNFFLSFLPFFGEEYGWRYYLTPLLQEKFGPRRGVLLLGVLWGLWHLPLNLFFYSPETSLQSLTAQIVVCITLGVFFTYAYERCGRNIWVPVLLHYLNNNMILVWTGTAEISNQVYGWGEILFTAVVYGLMFLPFLADKTFAPQKKTV